MTKKGLPLAARLRLNTRVEGDCWVWTKGTRAGYGLFALTCKVNVSAHRLSYEVHKGPIPGGLLVLHRCDNKLCVNPDHLFLGTHKDNTQDALRKGRFVSIAEWRRRQQEQVK